MTLFEVCFESFTGVEAFFFNISGSLEIVTFLKSVSIFLLLLPTASFSNNIKYNCIYDTTSVDILRPGVLELRVPRLETHRACTLS